MTCEDVLFTEPVHVRCHGDHPLCISMNTSRSQFAKNCGAASPLSNLCSSRCFLSMKSAQRVPGRLRPNSFPQSPKHGHRIPLMQRAVPGWRVMSMKTTCCPCTRWARVRGSEVCDGLRGDAFVAAQEVGFDNLCELVDGRPRGIETLIQHMRRMVFPCD